MTRRLSANRLGLLHGPSTGARLSFTGIFLPRVDDADTHSLCKHDGLIAPVAGLCVPAPADLQSRC